MKNYDGISLKIISLSKVRLNWITFKFYSVILPVVSPTDSLKCVV